MVLIVTMARISAIERATNVNFSGNLDSKRRDRFISRITYGFRTIRALYYGNVRNFLRSPEAGG